MSQDRVGSSSRDPLVCAGQGTCIEGSRGCSIEVWQVSGGGRRTEALAHAHTMPPSSTAWGPLCDPGQAVCVHCVREQQTSGSGSDPHENL
jgi:hypothetical protein